MPEVAQWVMTAPGSARKQKAALAVPPAYPKKFMPLL
jgi:hypothetical protein